MANRYPLILDTTDGNKIKELPAGDNLTLRENSIFDVQNINALGVINAPVITVNGNKIVAQNFADLTDTPNTFVGSENYFIKVNATGTGIEFRPLGDIANISVDNLTTTGNILPAVTGNNNIGSVALKYNQITALAVSANLISYAGSVVFDATTGKVSYSALQGAPAFLSEFTDDIGFLRTSDLDTTLAGLFDDGVPFTTDIVGSVFGDDSTLLVDGVTGIITGDVLNSQITTTNLIAATATLSTTIATTINGPSTGNLAIDAGTSGIINIGHNTTTAVNIKNAVIDSFDQGLGLGVAQLTASTDLIISAGNRVKVDGAVPFRLAHLSAAEISLVVALEGDVIYNTTTSRLQMYQSGAWLDVNGNVEATTGTSNFNDVIIAGDLTVSGTTTTIETTNTNITDNVITLNDGETGAGVTLGTSGIEIERGTSPNRSLVWTENFGGKWIVTDDATLLANRLEANYLVGSLSVSTDDLVMTDGNVTATGTLTMGGNGLVQIVSVTTDIELLPVGKVKVDGNLEVTGTFDGDVTGSVFGDDSTVLVDGNNNKVVGDIDTASLRTSETTIALGGNAGATNQGNLAVAIGNGAGQISQGAASVAIGDQAGLDTQGTSAIAIGNAGSSNQGAQAVAIGESAGYTGQGAQAIAIGSYAGNLSQAANSIVLNATGSAVQNTQASSFVVKPVRDAVGTTVMMYDATLGEITHTATPGTLAANIDQATVAIGATTATAIGIGNAGSTTTINGIVNLPALIAGEITADNSISITTATGDGNAISIGPGGTNRYVNITADFIRFNGEIIVPMIAKGGITGDIKGSVVGDDSTVLIDGQSSTIVGPVVSSSIAGTLVKATTIENNTTDDLAVNVDGFININAGTDDAGMSKIQMDQTGINHIEITTEPKVPGDANDVANIAINATAASGNVIIGTTGSTRNQVVTIHNATVSGTLVGSAQGAHTGTLTGDITGSVFSDDSSMMIDGISGTIVGPISKIVGDVQQISGPGAISLDTLITEITTTGTNDAYSLADGILGQIKIIAMVGDGGDAILTPTTLATGTTITFSDVNDNITLLFTSNGWLNTANQNATIA